LWGKVPDDVLTAIAFLDGDARLLDQCSAADRRLIRCSVPDCDG
jgi:hypothetical protein